MKVTSLSPAERNHAILWVVVVVNFLTVLVNYVKLYAEFFVFLSEWSTCLFAYRTDKWDPIASSYSRCRSRLVSKPRCKAVHLWSDHSGRMVIPRLSGLSVLSLASFTPFCHGVIGYSRWRCKASVVRFVDKENSRSSAQKYFKFEEYKEGKDTGILTSQCTQKYLKH